ncbi:MAG: hypothetical protein AB7G15_16145 [Alphaproteobacteria bacterium]
MIIGRFIGMILLFCAVAALAWDVVTIIDTGTFQLISFGTLWSKLHENSAIGFRELVEKVPFIKEYIYTPMMAAPACIVLFFFGLVFAIVFRRRRRRDD